LNNDGFDRDLDERRRKPPDSVVFGRRLERRRQKLSAALSASSCAGFTRASKAGASAA
jgi:hypothetical protein